MSIGEGNALSEHEATVLQAREIVSRQQLEWIKAARTVQAGSAAEACSIAYCALGAVERES